MKRSRVRARARNARAAQWAGRETVQEDMHHAAARAGAVAVQQNMIEAAFTSNAGSAFIHRCAELLAATFSADAVLISLPGEPIGQTVHHASIPAAAELVESCGLESPAAVTLFSGTSYSVAQTRADERFRTHNEQAAARNWLACCCAPLVDGEGRVFGALSFYFAAADSAEPDGQVIRKYVGPILAGSFAAPPQGSGPLTDVGRFASLAAAIPGVVYQRIVTPEANIRYTYMSESARDLFGVAPDEVLKDSEILFRRFSEEYKSSFRQRLLAASKSMTTWDVEASIVTPDGHLKYTHAIAKPERLADGSVLWTGVILDATRIKQAEAAAAAAEEQTRTAIVENLSQGFLLYDAHDRLVIRNSHFLNLYPNLRDIAVPGALYEDVIRTELASGSEFPFDDDDLERAVLDRLTQHRKAHSTFERRIGTLSWIQINEHRTADGGTVVLYTDVSELKQREQRIQHMALHDALTGLPNRVLFRRRVDEAIALSKEQREFAAVMCVDLDDFKLINDTLGHPVGDSFLRLVSERLSRCLREGDTVARLGGDEFAVVLFKVGTPESAASIAEHILEVLSQPLEIEGHQAVVNASIGIAMIAAETQCADRVLKAADLALYRAKADGRGTFRFFEEEMDLRVQRRRTLEIDLRNAILNQEFAVHYQPLIDIASNEITGVEALVRWRHPRRGLIPPQEFIPIAEETGLIAQLGEWVLRQACTDARCWPAEVCVAVNLSPAQFRSKDLAERIAAIIAETGLPPSRLELEITESLLLRNTESNLLTLHKLKSLGIRVSMDDFGTGYSSLSNLKSFPFDKIKIDHSFVRDMDNTHSVQIVRAVLNLGQNLGLKTTAEGVETLEQLQFLRQEGCAEAQGFYYCPAIPSDQVEQLLLRKRKLCVAAS